MFIFLLVNTGIYRGGGKKLKLDQVTLRSADVSSPFVTAGIVDNPSPYPPIMKISVYSKQRQISAAICTLCQEAHSIIIKPVNTFPSIKRGSLTGPRACASPPST